MNEKETKEQGFKVFDGAGSYRGGGKSYFRDMIIADVQVPGTEIRYDRNLNTVAVYRIDVLVQRKSKRDKKTDKNVNENEKVAERKKDELHVFYRRYNQFYELDILVRHKLKVKTRLPRKTFFKSGTDSTLMDQRRKRLQTYLNQLNDSIKEGPHYRQFVKWFFVCHDSPLVSFTDPQKTGYMRKEGHVVRNWKRRWFILKDDNLLYFRRRLSDNSWEGEQIKGIVNLAGATVSDAPDKPGFAMLIKSPDLPDYYLSLNSQASKDEWKKALLGVTLKFPKALQIDHHHQNNGNNDSSSSNKNRRNTVQRVGSPVDGGIFAMDRDANVHHHDNFSIPTLSRNSSNSSLGSGDFGRSPPGLHNFGSPGSLVIDWFPFDKKKSLDKINLTLETLSKINPVENASRTRSFSCPGLLSEDATDPSFIEFLTSIKTDLEEERIGGGTKTNRAKISFDSRLSIEKEKADMELKKFIKRLDLKMGVIEAEKKKRIASNDIKSSRKASLRQLELESQERSLRSLRALAVEIIGFTPKQLMQTGPQANHIGKQLVQRVQKLQTENINRIVNRLLFIISPVLRLLDAAHSSNYRISSPPATAKNYLQSQKMSVPSLNSHAKQSRIDQLEAVSENEKMKLPSATEVAKKMPLKRGPAFALAQTQKFRSSSVDVSQSPFKGLVNQSASINLPVKKAFCYICEEYYKVSVLAQHTYLCSIANQRDLMEVPCDERMCLLLESCQELKEKDQSLGYLIQVENIVRRVVMLKHDSPQVVSECFRLLQDLQTILAIIDDEEDLVVLTFGRRICGQIEEKWVLMKEYLNLEKSMDSGKRKKNMWGFLFSLLRKGQGNESVIKQELCELSPEMASFFEKRRYDISIDDFSLLKPISRGAFGRVYLGKKKSTGDLFAIKVLRKAHMTRKNMVDNVIAERNILASMDNPFVVRLFYAFENSQSLFLVMEYLPGGDVASLLNVFGTFDLKMCQMYTAEAVLALEYLHKLNIIHRDLKPENMLINSQGHIQLTDFGLSSIGVDTQETETEQKTNTTRSRASSKNAEYAGDSTGNRNRSQFHKVIGTPDYLSPEILLGLGHTTTTDWWSLGIVLYELICGCPPFNDTTVEKIFQKIVNLNISWDDELLSPEAKSLISQLLVSDPNKRLTDVEKIKQHPFFDGIDWSTVLTRDMSDIFVPKPDDALDTGYFEDRRKAFVSSNFGSSANKGASTSQASVKSASSRPKRPIPILKSERSFGDFTFRNVDYLKTETLRIAALGTPPNVSRM